MNKLYHRDSIDEYYNRFIKDIETSKLIGNLEINNIDDLKQEVQDLIDNNCLYEDIFYITHKMINGEELITSLEIYPSDEDTIIHDDNNEQKESKNILVLHNYVRYGAEKDGVMPWYGQKIDINNYNTLEDFMEECKRRARYYAETSIFEVIRNYGEEYYLDENWEG